MQAFGMRFLRLGSGRSRTAAGVREGTRLDAMRRRLIIKKENDMATPYKECPHCGAHLDSGENAIAARRKPTATPKRIEREDKGQ